MNEEKHFTVPAENTGDVIPSGACSANEEKKHVLPTEIVGDVMTFSTYSALFCGNHLGWFGEDAALSVGVVQVCLAGLFFTGAFRRISLSSFWGNMNLIFAFFFGITGGVTTILVGAGVAMNPLVLAVPNLVAGFVLLATIPATLTSPKVACILNSFAAIAVFSLGLAGVGIAPTVLNTLAGILLGGVAVLGIYTVVSTFFGYSGLYLPVGKPFKQ